MGQPSQWHHLSCGLRAHSLLRHTLCRPLLTLPPSTHPPPRPPTCARYGEMTPSASPGRPAAVAARRNASTNAASPALLPESPLVSARRSRAVAVSGGARLLARVRQQRLPPQAPAGPPPALPPQPCRPRTGLSRALHPCCVQEQHAALRVQSGLQPGCQARQQRRRTGRQLQRALRHVICRRA